MIYDEGSGKVSVKSANLVSNSKHTRTHSTAVVGLARQKSAFLYEPTMVSSKLIRAWQQETGHRYYDLSPQSRSKMNVALRN